MEIIRLDFTYQSKDDVDVPEPQGDRKWNLLKAQTDYAEEEMVGRWATDCKLSFTVSPKRNHLYSNSLP